ncbi:MAG: hypothetical protein AAFZ58_10805 [Pseudomonadota bacterium]
MSAQANPTRDVFAFSLGGLAAKNSYAYVPAIADDALNNNLDRQQAGHRESRSSAVQAFEDFLARYFATGCRQAA